MKQKENPPPDCYSTGEGSLTVDDALVLIKDLLPVIDDARMLALDKCAGHVTAEAIVCQHPLPSFANSSMDGYAFRYEKSGKPAEHRVTLTEVGVSLAGHPYSGAVAEGQCVRITTGAKLPADCDTVVIQENTLKSGNEGETTIELTNLPAQGENVRPIGSNLNTGDVLCEPGSKISPALLGLIASTGLTEVSCIRPLKVAVFSTGDELVTPGQTLQEGQIYDANGYLLKSLLQSPCIEIIDLGIVADTVDDVRRVMQQAMQADVAVSSGGVSVGEADVVKQVLDEVGTLQMWKILMKPGRPLTFGTLESGTRYFGLPGNPVSAMVTFAVFLVPALHHMLGLKPKAKVLIKAVSCDNLKKQAGRMELQRGILSQRPDGQWQVATTGLQDSHILASMAQANCFVRLPLESQGAAAGEAVDAIPFNSLSI